MKERMIKPYWYFRNGYIHCRYTVDRAIKLTDAEVRRLKEHIAVRPYDKQTELEWQWQVCCQDGEREEIDGIDLADRIVKEKRMTKYQVLQETKDRAERLAKDTKDKNMKRFYLNAKIGAENKMRNMTIAEASEK
jgi:hypothetical protein